MASDIGSLISNTDLDDKRLPPHHWIHPSWPFIARTLRRTSTPILTPVCAITITITATFYI